MTTPMRRRRSPARLIAVDLEVGRKAVNAAKGRVDASYQEVWDEIRKALDILITRLRFGVVQPHPLNLYDVSIQEVPIARFEIYEHDPKSPRVPRSVRPGES